MKIEKILRWRKNEERPEDFEGVLGPMEETIQ